MLRIRRNPAALTLGFLALGLGACAPQPAEEPAAEPTAEATAKVPITSASEEAVELYLKARDLGDKLRFPEARQVYQQAVAKDQGFALAHLGLANTSTSAQEFFESLDRAEETAGNATEAERWLIHATRAGADGDPAAQKNYLNQLVDAHPSDERVHLLLANWHNGRQEYDEALGHYQRAIEIDPEFSGPYNMLGYLQRTLGDNDAAESAFVKYIELLPDEPNPYDSYAELLMKTGRFEESIANYEKALARDEHFVASYVGIGNNRIFMGQGEAARESFAELAEVARNDGERRQAGFWTAVSYLHEGDYEKALASLDERYRIAAASDDKATLSGDLNLMGNVLLHRGDPDAAAEKFAAAVAMIEQADVSDEIKENTRRNHLYDEARVALHRDDLDTAAAKLEEYAEAVGVKQIPFEVRRTHELAGMLALHRGDGETALAELRQANQQNPRVLYLQAKACQHQGDEEGMRTFAARVADWNQLNLNLAFVKSKAEHLAAGDSGS